MTDFLASSKGVYVSTINYHTTWPCLAHSHQPARSTKFCLNLNVYRLLQEAKHVIGNMNNLLFFNLFNPRLVQRWKKLRALRRRMTLIRKPGM